MLELLDARNPECNVITSGKECQALFQNGQTSLFRLILIAIELAGQIQSPRPIDAIFSSLQISLCGLRIIRFHCRFKRLEQPLADCLLNRLGTDQWLRTFPEMFDLRDVVTTQATASFDYVAGAS